MKELIVTIDGPAGSGKSTTARDLAALLGYVYIDTGAMYRAAGLKASREKFDLDDEEQVEKLCGMLDIKQSAVDGLTVTYLDGEDVSRAIRTPEMSQMASIVSTKNPVRHKLVELQRLMGRAGGVVMEGRDIGTVVFPEAEAKFFMDASPRIRARRRYEELIARGEKVVYEDTLAAMIERDKRDSTRDNSPLKIPEGAVRIDTSDIPADVVLEMLRSRVEEVRGR